MITSLKTIASVFLGSANAKINKATGNDLLIIKFNAKAITVASFTKNAFCAAPIILAKKHLTKTNNIQALVINSGNANAGTGKQGLNDAKHICKLIAKQLSCKPTQVLPFSTGVIGEYLPILNIEKTIPTAIHNLSTDNWQIAANTILTTDLAIKTFSKTINIDGNKVSITGIAKGSGMIHPNMATMLGFVTTDAKINQKCLQKILTQSVNKSFNRITVDGDTSTNDACTLTATQQVNMPIIDDENSATYQQFASLVNECMVDLAHKIIRDGEGATKFVSIIVESALNSKEALKVAYSVALSPLVKTALFASDPNWGRILAAVGKAGIKNFKIDQLQIYLADVLLVENGARAKSYTEQAGQAVMNNKDIVIRIVLNRGEITETIWTTDLSYDYIKINAEYRS